MKAFVVDTNVAVVASGRADHAGPDCILACVAALGEVIQTGKLVLDSGMLILTEYMGNLSMSGQPGPGDAFMKWAWRMQAVTERCERVPITRVGNSFGQFPNDPKLSHFHLHDHKFVAVALASSNDPEVLNAVDSDWWDFRAPLRKHGVRIRFLCPNHVGPGSHEEGTV